MSDSTPQPYFPQDLDNYAPWVAEYGLLQPYGECQCGCGELTRITTRTHRTHGYLKGEPVRYIKNHNSRLYLPNPNPSGLCMCGCGELTPLAKATKQSAGLVAGMPVKFIPGHNVRVRTDLDRCFWDKVNKTAANGCWIWTGKKSTQGYGKLKFKQKNHIASRFSWELHNGPIPGKLFVCHNCPTGDNPLCVNPAHLFLGTAKDNSQDMVAKGRASRIYGAANPLAKLTNEQVLEIRRLYDERDYGISQIAKLHEISTTTVSRVVHRRRYTDI